MMDINRLNHEIEETEKFMNGLIFDGSMGSLVTIITSKTTLRTLLLVKGLSFDEVTEYMNDNYGMFDFLDNYELIAKKVIEW